MTVQAPRFKKISRSAPLLFACSLMGSVVIYAATAPKAPERKWVPLAKTTAEAGVETKAEVKPKKEVKATVKTSAKPQPAPVSPQSKSPAKSTGTNPITSKKSGLTAPT